MPEKLKVALVQTSLHWENPEANRTMLSHKIETIQGKADLIVLPEMFTTGFTMSPQNIDASEGSKTISWMQDLAKKSKVAVVGSLAFQENNKNYNRLIFVHPDGQVNKYDKKHTFTFAGEDKVYTAGTERLVIDFMGFRICPLICYDLRFPVWARNTEAYDVLIYVANWPTPRIAAWDALLKARAIENMSYCIGVNRIGVDDLGYEYSGHSAVYDVLGNTMAFSQKEETLYVELEREHITTYRNKLKFLEDQDDFSLK